MGGHPDWVLSSCGRLRSTDPKYLGCVSGWYAALARQARGHWWKEGGAIVAVQVDNETPDWKYLLALKDLASSHGFAPAFYTKTGWPAPSTGYPEDYPMLPYFGGYADLFWTNDMHPDASAGGYLFSRSPQGRDVPPGFPWLDVEIGGGMAAAYNHRVHMMSADMPAMHLVDLGSGVNQLGYYMYHGGNNPHSTVHAKDRDAPNSTLQESSFQPAGAANPMPSESYDFFAPLGEFGQPRPHYHMMRRLHLLLDGWGAQVAASVPSAPEIIPSGPSDNTTVRWQVRSSGGAGWLFVNNYARLESLSPKHDVRFLLRWHDATSGVATSSPPPPPPPPPLAIPSNDSKALTLGLGWFVWPFGLDLLPTSSSSGRKGLRSSSSSRSRSSSSTSFVARLEWATAQLLTHADLTPTHRILFLAETHGIPPEIGLCLGSGTQLLSHSGSITREGRWMVLRAFPTGTSPVATVQVGGRRVSLVLLPAASEDRVWVGTLAGARRVVLSAEAELALFDGDFLRVRSLAGVADAPAIIGLSICPPLSDLRLDDSTALPFEADGVFTKFTLSVPPIELPPPKVALVRSAGPPRKIPINPRSHKPQEPTSREWDAAARYSITLCKPPTLAGRSLELRLKIDYAADAARVYFGDVLLTDSWFSGYQADGGLEIGLSYLVGERPALLDEGAELTLLILPLTREALDSNVFLQTAFWPDFGSALSVVEVKAAQMIALVRSELRATA